MKRSKMSVWLGALAVALLAAAVASTATWAAGGPPTGRGVRGAQAFGQAPAGAGTGYALTGTLDEDEVAVLNEFLLDEHKALATYESVMAQFGEVEPFASIARAEQQHIAALERIYSRYDVALPAIPAFDVPTFASVEAAAAAGAQAEIDNAALYDALLDQIDNLDVLRVAENLRSASLNHHLPAFQAVVDGTYVPGTYGPSTGVGQGGPQGVRGSGAWTEGARGARMRGLGTGECLVTDSVQE